MSANMHFLVSNDDGFDAPGIAVLAEAMSALGRVTIVAPDRDRSGASNSLTLHLPIRASRRGPDRYRIAGTPTDCVHLGLTGLLESQPDMVVSGINYGANMGDDVLYSGTVAAAMEGRFLGLPAMAISLATQGRAKHFDSAGKAAARITRRLLVDPLPADTILNVNVPDLPTNELKGFEVTRLGHRHQAEPAIQTEDPRGRRLYWIGPPGAEDDDGPGTDFHALRNGYVSITPIHTDLTRYQALENVARWVQTMGEEGDDDG